jgi:SAM-dependent methyltransferase
MFVMDFIKESVVSMTSKTAGDVLGKKRKQTLRPDDLTPEQLDEKFEMYERAVQTPDVHAEFYDRVYRETRGKKARRLREDFCGSFAVCCEWSKLRPNNEALGLDLDSFVVDYGKRVHFSKLEPEQQRRVRTELQDVLQPPKEKFDLIVAANFSFCIFKERQTMLDYFKACLTSLDEDGVLVLEHAGGPGMIEEDKEKTKFKRDGKKWFTYIWDQQSFDPLTHDAMYAIHFKKADGTYFEDAFVYDWRLWSLPELVDLMKEAGFNDVICYWETRDEDDELTGEYQLSANGSNDEAWVSYLVGKK